MRKISYEEIFKIKWKTIVCQAGESCWCRYIVPEEDVIYENDEEVVISTSGCLSKDVANYIVNLHNFDVDFKSKVIDKRNFLQLDLCNLRHLLEQSLDDPILVPQLQ